MVRSLPAAVLLLAWCQPAAATEWDVSLWGERRASTEHVHRLAELVEERTDGALRLNIDYGGLSRPSDNLDGLSIGAFEMAQICAGYHVDKNPALTVLELPFLGIADPDADRLVSEAVYAHPAVQHDLSRWQAEVLMPSPMPPLNLAGVGEDWRTLAHLRGKRVGTSGGIAKALEMLGVAPAPVEPSKMREALVTRIADAVALPMDSHLAFGTLDEADWWTSNLDLGNLACPIVVATEALEALEPEQRTALLDSREEALDASRTALHELETNWPDLLNERGVRQIEVPDPERQALSDAAARIHEQWVADAEVAKLPGRELYQLVQDTLREQRAGER